jgi:c-di-GMP-binding flagellar brake protein YcgR
VENNMNQGAGETEETFASLGLAVGSAITIETVSPVRKYQVQLLGYCEGRSVMISSPTRDGKEVLLDKGSSVAVRLLKGMTVCAFETRISYRSIQPYTYYHLVYPEDVKILQVRNSERVDTLITAEIDSDFDVVGEWPKPAYINNLSKTGARMTSPQSLGEKGHEVLVSFLISVSGMNKQVCLPGIIRNIELSNEVEVGDEGRYTVGVEFFDLSDEQRLTLSSYIYEHDGR